MARNKRINKLCRTSDTLRKKKGVEPTPTPPLISYGNREKQMLHYLILNKDTRLNIKAYSRFFKIPRSSIYDSLNKLTDLGLVSRVSVGNYKITQKGEYSVEVGGGVGKSRRECRELRDISQHYTKYKLMIKDRSKFTFSNLKTLKPYDIKTVELPNLTIHYAYFDMATLIIKPKQVIIRVSDITDTDTEETLLKSFNLALYYIDRLNDINLLTEERIELENTHYAKVRSHLSEFLSKIDRFYYLELGNKRKFWIDYSDNKIEDETNDIEYRERLDKFLKDLGTTDILLSDVDKIIEALGLITKIKIMDIKTQIKPVNNGHLKEKIDYVG